MKTRTAPIIAWEIVKGKRLPIRDAQFVEERLMNLPWALGADPHPFVPSRNTVPQGRP